MKVLWLVNSKLPAIDAAQGRKSTDCVGGWMTGLYDGLIGRLEIDHLVVCYPADGASDHPGRSGALSYCPFDPALDMKTADAFVTGFRSLLVKEQPDVVHIHGSEFPHALGMAKAAEQCGMLDRVVCSIQGLVSVIAKHFFAGLPEKYRWSMTLKEFFRRSSLRQQYESYVRRGKEETELIAKLRYVIGRTSWDRACIHLINPQVEYLFCNETLRGEFYTGRWQYDACRRHSVFLSQGMKPIKGLHCLIEATAIVKRRYPDVMVFVAGVNMVSGKRWRIGSYARYLLSMIDRLGLQEHIVFIGPLSAAEVKEQMLATNVFVQPSAIENSPNSLGEAMLLGVPCIASDVGGVVDMLAPNIEGIVYPFNEYYKLAYHIMQVFDLGGKAAALGAAAAVRAARTHSRIDNADRMLEIYKRIGCAQK